jgi:hypothetical protein
MKTKLFFRQFGGLAFKVDIFIMSESHLENFIKSMNRKGFQQVDEQFFEKDMLMKSRLLFD